MTLQIPHVSIFPHEKSEVPVTDGYQAWVRKNKRGPAGPKKPVTVMEQDNPLWVNVKTVQGTKGEVI